MISRGTSSITSPNPIQVGVVNWRQNDGISAMHAERLESLGYKVVNFLFDDRLPPKLDVILAHGPLGSLVPLANQLLASPSSQRPFLVLVQGEQLPNPNLPEWLCYGCGLLRSRAERLAFRQQAAGEWRVIPWLKWLTTKAYRFRYYGDLYWLRQQGILSVLALRSRWTADFLRARGFDPIVLSPSYHSNLAVDLKLKRDIPVLWIGKIATARRRRLLKRLRAVLRERGIEILVIDGVEHPYVFGEARTILLNRTKIVVNLLRRPWDNNSLRFLLATHNGCLTITEPTLPHTPYLPGAHLVEAPLEQMADTICYYLSHEEQRQQIVKQAVQMLKTNTVMGKGIEQIFERIGMPSECNVPVYDGTLDEQKGNIRQ